VQTLIETSWSVAILDFVFPDTRGQRPADFETTLKFGIALTRLAAEDPAVHKLTRRSPKSIEAAQRLSRSRPGAARSCEDGRGVTVTGEMDSRPARRRRRWPRLRGDLPMGRHPDCTGSMKWHRHTGTWFCLYRGLSLVEALKTIEADGLLHPL
jgi:hypothetical protein